MTCKCGKKSTQTCFNRITTIFTFPLLFPAKIRTQPLETIPVPRSADRGGTADADELILKYLCAGFDIALRIINLA
eukprot:1395255-Amorphochlora_amoeboformis.AAC.2